MTWRTIIKSKKVFSLAVCCFENRWDAFQPMLDRLNNDLSDFLERFEDEEKNFIKHLDHFLSEMKNCNNESVLHKELSILQNKLIDSKLEQFSKNILMPVLKEITLENYREKIQEMKDYLEFI